MKNLKNVKGLKELTRNDQKSINGGLFQLPKCFPEASCQYGCSSTSGCSVGDCSSCKESFNDI